MTAIPVVDPVAYGRLKQEVLSAATESALPGWAKSLFQQAYEGLDIMGTKNWEVGS